MWKLIETKAEKTRVAKAEGRRKERRRGKEVVKKIEGRRKKEDKTKK